MQRPREDVLSVSELSVHRTELFPELDRSEFRRPKGPMVILAFSVDDLI